MDRPIVVGLGELLWDVFGDSRRPGGAPANVAFHAGQLGAEGVPCSRVGRDRLGDELVAFLAGQCLATDWVQRDSRHPTGTVTVDTSLAQAPRYTIHENVAWDHLELDDALRRLAAGAAAICFGTLAQRSPASRQAIEQVLGLARPRCLIVYDVNLRQHYYDRAAVERSMTHAGVVKLNAEEVDVLADLLQTGSAGHERFARVIQERHDVRAVCITRGDRGSLLVDGDEVVDHPGVTVSVADAVGAGDAFTAALIVARLAGRPAEAQLALANEVGALVASRPGAMPVLKEEFADLWKRFDSRASCSGERIS